MIPINQTKFTPGEGDCLLAAIASVLHRPLESIPNFMTAGDGQWFNAFYEWCAFESIGLVYMSPEHFDHSLMLNLWAVLIYSVVGHEDGEHHACVGQAVLEQRTRITDGTAWRWRFNLVHNPNPQMTETLGELLYAIILIPPPCPDSSVA